MADRWAAELRIHAWPGGVRVETRTRYGTSNTYNLEIPDFEGVPEEVAEIMRGVGLDQAEDFHREEDGSAYFMDPECAGGIYAWTEEGLAEALQEAGLAFEMWDEGRYENPGQHIEWRPGMDDPHEIAVLAGGEHALPGSRWKQISKTPGRTPEQIVEAVSRYFNPR